MYTLVNKAGNDVRVTKSEAKRDELLRLGYHIAVNDEQEDAPKRKKRVSQSTAAASGEAQPQTRKNAAETRKNETDAIEE